MHSRRKINELRTSANVFVRVNQILSFEAFKFRIGMTCTICLILLVCSRGIQIFCIGIRQVGWVGWLLKNACTMCQSGVHAHNISRQADIIHTGWGERAHGLHWIPFEAYPWNARVTTATSSDRCLMLSSQPPHAGTGSHGMLLDAGAW